MGRGGEWRKFALFWIWTLKFSFLLISFQRCVWFYTFFTIKVLRSNHVCLGFSVLTLCRNLSWKGQLLWLHNKYSVMHMQWFKKKKKILNWTWQDQLQPGLYSWRKTALLLYQERSISVLWFCGLKYRIFLPLSSKMLKFIIWSEIQRGQDKLANSCCGLVVCSSDY